MLVSDLYSKIRSSLKHTLAQFYDFVFEAPNLTNVEEHVTTGDSATTGEHATYETRFTTGATEGAETYNAGDPSAKAGVKTGVRRLFVLDTRTDDADSVAFDHANFSQGSDTITGIALDAEDEELLVEARADKWEVIHATSGVVSTE